MGRGQSLYDWCQEDIENRGYLLEEWDYNKNNLDFNLTPQIISIGSLQKIWWICNKKHSFEQAICNRTKKKYKCPYCSGKKVLKGYNDLVTTNPDLIKEWDYNKNTIEPTEVSAGSNKKVYWLCKNKHSWEAAINNRSKGSGCPYCSGNKVIKGETDLVTTHPELIKEWDFEKKYP